MATRDVLICADPETIEHKLVDEVPDDHHCYWTVSGTPRQTGSGAAVLFCDGDRVHARGTIVDVEDGRLWFTPLREVDEDLPAEPVTRGFKYVEGSHA